MQTSLRMINQDPLISIVLPSYNCAESIRGLYEEIISALEHTAHSYEIIFIDDGSPENDWGEIKSICKIDKRVRGLSFARNFGQHEAITAGLAHTKGTYIVVMDCDLQHDPFYIPMLIDKLKEGFDIVYACHEERRHSALRNLLAGTFEVAFNWLSRESSSDSKHSSYTCLSRRTVKSFLKVNDHHRHYLLILKWLGLSSAEIKVEHRVRPLGESSYTPLKLLKHAINGFTSQTTLVLKFSIISGLLYIIGAAFYSSYLIIAHFLYGFKEGWTSVMLLLLFSTGTILLSLGVVGLYLSKVLEQVRQRPLYLIKEYLNMESKDND